MPRTRRVDCSGPGIARRRHGRGFAYLDEHGTPLRDEPTIDRIRALAIPPAWSNVWICTDPCGHIQATGIDAAGRKQYRYHDDWRRRRDQAKFDAMISFARALPALRRVRPLIASLKRRRSGGEELLAFRRGRRWIDVKADDVNAYLKRRPSATRPRSRAAPTSTRA